MGRAPIVDCVEAAPPRLHHREPRRGLGYPILELGFIVDARKALNVESTQALEVRLVVSLHPHLHFLRKVLVVAKPFVQNG